jgi:hypothetical protein
MLGTGVLGPIEELNSKGQVAKPTKHSPPLLFMIGIDRLVIGVCCRDAFKLSSASSDNRVMHEMLFFFVGVSMFVACLARTGEMAATRDRPSAQELRSMKETSSHEWIAS